MRYAIGVVAIFAVALVIQSLVHMARTDPRDSRAIAEREFQVNSIQPVSACIARCRSSSAPRSTTSARRVACSCSPIDDCCTSDWSRAIARGARSSADVRGARFPARHDPCA